MTMMIAFYTREFSPFREHFTQNTEFFNEVSLVMVVISLMGMTDATSYGNQVVCGYIYGFIIA